MGFSLKWERVYPSGSSSVMGLPIYEGASFPSQEGDKHTLRVPKLKTPE